MAYSVSFLLHSRFLYDLFINSALFTDHSLHLYCYVANTSVKIVLLYLKSIFKFKKKTIFLIVKCPCITITSGVHNFTQVKMHMTCVVVMKNEYIHVCTKRLNGLNSQLHIPHVKNHAKFYSHLFTFSWHHGRSSCDHVISHVTRRNLVTIWT